MSIKGTTIQYVKKTLEGYDPLNAPIYSEKLEDVPDVLVGQPSTDDIKSSLALYDKKITYMLGIPKGDTHDWVDAEVVIWGDRYRTFGFPMTGEQANIPLRWGQNVRVERYG
jgi:hypothetical protein